MEIEGIVLRFVAFKEKDAMITVLSKDGIISFLARGVLSVSSANASSVLLFSYSRFELNEGKSGGLSLKIGSIIESYGKKANNYLALSSLSFLGEITLKSQEIIEDYNTLFNFLLASLKAIEDGFDPRTVILIYSANVLKLCGTSLCVSKCVICESKQKIVSYSFDKGGLICENCFDSFSEKLRTPEEINAFRYIFMAKIDDLKRFELPKAVSLNLIQELEIEFVDALGIKLNSVKLIIID